MSRACSQRATFGCFFFFNDTATTEIYTLSLHDALPISSSSAAVARWDATWRGSCSGRAGDRKSTRLNSSHGYISYAVFCLKKKKTETYKTPTYVSNDQTLAMMAASGKTAAVVAQILARR